MEDYKKKYERALYDLEIIKNANKDNKELVAFIEYEYPELKESEDEKIRKALIHYFSEQDGILTAINGSVSVGDILAWLEKQDEKSNKLSIWKHWKDGIAGNGEGKLTYLIKIGNTYNLTSCLGFECDYIELSELDKLCVKKQGEQSKQHLYDIIIALWDLLDKIDTFSDLQIDDTNLGNSFRKIEDITQERHKFVKSDGYNLYIKGEQITDFKQDEQKPTDKVEPKFKVGDTIVEKDLDEYDYETIKDIKDGQYIFTDGYCMNIDEQEGWQLVKTTVNIEQKPVEWSAYDKATLEYIIEDIKELCNNETEEGSIETYNRELNLLQAINKSIKLSSYTNPAAWSKEDEDNYVTALWHIKRSSGREGSVYNWLKSLKERYSGSRVMGRLKLLETQ